MTLILTSVKEYTTAMSNVIRYPELDVLRGVAVLLMVVYHFFFDLAYFYSFDIPVRAGLWKLFALGTASLFLLLVGVCFVISWERKSTNGKKRKLFQRAGTIFAGGMVLSLVTWFVAPEAFIKFGILHLIGVSALLQPLFTRFRGWNLLVGSGIFLIGIFLKNQTTGLLWLFPFGIPYPGFRSLDYYPLLPWFGIILIGMALGYLLYVPTRRFSWNMAVPRGLQGFTWCGRRALLLYFLHQPILLLLLSLFLGLPST